MLGRMNELSALLKDTTRPTVVAELSQLVDSTVAGQSGLTGMAVKSTVAAVKKADADAVRKGVDRFLPEIVRELTPYWEDYDPAASAGFGNYLASRQDDGTASLLSLGDRFADQGPAAIAKAYSGLRGKAGKIVGPALPELGDIVERNAG